MKTFVRMVHSWMIVGVVAYIVVACTPIEHPASVPLEPIPVIDVSSVAGDWEGILVQMPASRNDDWVRLRIQEDGTYHFEVVRTIGVFSGDGRFVVKDGTLVAKSERGTITLQLHHHSGKDDRILKAKGESIKGVASFADLTPKPASGGKRF